MCSDFVALKMADLFSHWLVLEKRSGIKLFKLQTRKSITLKFEYRSAAKHKIMKSERLWCILLRAQQKPSTAYVRNFFPN